MKRAGSGIRWRDMAEVSYRVARLFRALSNPKVLAACELLLEQGEMQPGEIVDGVGRGKETVSRFLRELRNLNVVRYQKTGTDTWYTVKHPEELRTVISAGKAFVRHAEENLDGET